VIPKHDTIYLLPDGRRAMCKISPKYTLLLAEGKTGDFDTLVYMIAYGWLYQIVRLPDGLIEWQPSEWMATDLVEVGDGKTH
jgi:hypothetical protein